MIAYIVRKGRPLATIEEQIERLVGLGYPGLLGCPAEEFRHSLQGLTEHVPAGAAVADVRRGTFGFVVVVHAKSAPAARTLPLVKRQGHVAVERLFPRSPDFFKPTPSVSIPAGDAYLLLDVDRGNETLNAVPLEAEQRLGDEGRSPLTLEEGIAVLTQCPDFLQPNHCFMMLGSRGDDKRVPALWLSGKQPKLGWCWQGNPHTWLGFASCRARSPGITIVST